MFQHIFVQMLYLLRVIPLVCFSTYLFRCYICYVLFRLYVSGHICSDVIFVTCYSACMFQDIFVQMLYLLRVIPLVCFSTYLFRCYICYVLFRLYVPGDTLEGQLICKKNYKDPRSLVIRLSIRDETFKYTMQ